MCRNIIKFTTLPAAMATLSLTIFGSSAFAFEPALVSDQPNITIEMLDFELEQFVQWSKARAAQLNKPQLERTAEQTRVDLERGRQLYSAKQISLEDLKERESAYEIARTTIELNDAAETLARAKAEVSKFKIIEQGQQSAAPLVEAAEAQVRYLKAFQILMEKAMINAESRFRLAKFLEDNAKKLIESGGIPLEVFEKRKLERQKAETDVTKARTEYEAYEPAIQAAQRTLERLRAP